MKKNNHDIHSTKSDVNLMDEYSNSQYIEPLQKYLKLKKKKKIFKVYLSIKLTTSSPAKCQ